MAQKGKIIKLKSTKLSIDEIINDYRWAVKSREASLLGRREVMGGKAKFGIFGDGKEIPQLAMARAFQKGDFRSGYYRDQTFMFATGMLTIQQYFAQLYAHADVDADPASAGRSMNGHFATRFLNSDSSWKNQTEIYNSTADISPTGSQMPRAVGLAYASRLYRNLEDLKQYSNFSNNGNEICFATIGNASCAEGMFWEAINAAGVLKSPLLVSIWDDYYGISVTNENQITKEDIFALLQGFKRKRGLLDGLDLYSVQGWDYPALVDIYQKATKTMRRDHLPAVIHVAEVTQPLGHSTSGNHERYKSKERLEWEKEFDGIKKMREWLIAEEIITADELDEMEAEDKKLVREIRDQAWAAYSDPICEERDEAAQIMREIAAASSAAKEINHLQETLTCFPIPSRRQTINTINDILIATKDENIPARQKLIDWKTKQLELNEDRYGSHVYSQSRDAILNIPEVKPIYSNTSPSINGFEILNVGFGLMLERDPLVIAFGEDVGQLGGVNQGFRNLQEQHGVLRVADTGIRECTILGQAIGMAMRGLRPLAEIQYLDYILYALQIISDDLATLQWRTKGGQKAPVIIRTRGHRLEGIWHSGSPMAGIINLVRGLNVFVPRNMVQAAGFYNALLQSDEPGLVVEVLNAYRLKERLPDNIGEITIPAGVPEVLKVGTDVTMVTYGACCRIAVSAAKLLHKVGIEAEVIDVRSLLPFDINGVILESLKKTNRIVFIDEDMPGGTTAYMLQQVLEVQDGYHWLDSKPLTIPAKNHRPAYGSDGDYFSKPNEDFIFERIYELMHEADPRQYPIFWK